MTPGQAAFEAWAERLDRPYPASWRQLSDKERGGWEEIAAAAVEARYEQLRGQDKRP